MTSDPASVSRVTSVVEGHGEVAALPILLRRVAAERGYYPQINKPHRIARSDFRTRRVADAYRLQRARATQTGVVVLLCDLDDDDLQELNAAIAQQVPISPGVVIGVAVREYEAWFLAALGSLRGHRAVRDNAADYANPEGPRNAKKPLEEAMTESYKETIHQPAFSELLDLEGARGRSSSFSSFCELLWAALAAEDARR